MRGQLPLLHSLKGDSHMATDTLTIETEEIHPKDGVLQTDKEDDTSTYFIAGLVAAECGVTLTANWLLSASATSIQASLGYFGIAILAWGTVCVVNSVPALLDSEKATEEDVVVTTRQNSDSAATILEMNTGQAVPMSIEPDSVVQTETSEMAPVFHAETSLPTASLHTTAQ